MQVKINKFCALATSPSWQAWLFHFNQGLYQKFFNKLQVSRGCNQNRDLMIELLKEIELVPGGTESILTFLQKHYPSVLNNGIAQPSVVRTSPATNKVFEYYNPNLLTYPRRLVIEHGEVERLAIEFIRDKIRSDFVIVDGKAYIEYLLASDEPIKDKIPTDNWVIRRWRSRNQK